LDIDHFKKINDRYGHAGGDVALRLLTSTVKQCLSRAAPSAIFSRTGGEEFTVVVPGFDLLDAYSLAEILRERVSTVVVDVHSSSFGMTVSIGVASLSERDATFAALLARADEALYDAKATGRNRVCKSLPKAFHAFAAVG